LNLELLDTAWVVSKHSQEDESEEPDFGDSDSDVSAQQVRHAEDVLSVRLQTQIWLPRQAKPVKKDKEALRQEAWFFGSLKRSLDTLGFVPVCKATQLDITEISPASVYLEIVACLGMFLKPLADNPETEEGYRGILSFRCFEMFLVTSAAR
jgi:hypothetical protein